MTQNTMSSTDEKNAETYTGSQLWSMGYQAVSQPPSPKLQGANQKQEGGSHYKSKAIQPWDYIIANNLGYLEGNIIKYVSRWKNKGGVQDLNKAMHYLEKLIETST